ncbi:MAG: alpha/beta fold hydrolase [Chryseobacterium sp.]|nr:MAG: alpha/beta fold hydrolase [Chryseobacterium sp.]
MLQTILSFIQTHRLLMFFVTLLIIQGKDANAQSITVNGATIDVRTLSPLPYVSIGIKNKPLGTVSDSTGKYSLSYKKTDIADGDSIIFSAVGYRSVKMTLNDFLKTEKTVKLSESQQMLETVNIKAQPSQIKNYGRSNASLVFFPAMYKNIPKQSDEKGREQATLLKIDRDVFLRKLNFGINRRAFKKIKLRMNIYDVKQGIPGESILHKDVVFDILGTTEIGMPRVENVDLRPYQIHLTGRKEIAVSLAVLDLEPLEGDSSKSAFFIPSFPSPLRSSLFRIKGEASWQKVSASYLLVALEVSSMKIGKKASTENLEESDDEVAQENANLSGLLYGNNKGKRIKVADGEIYYEIYGKGEPLFLMHGNNESINSFREQIEPLAKHYRIIALDTRGQGNSINRKTLAYSYEQFADDLSAVMNAMSIKKASLLGWSDGGNTALAFALKHPEKVEKMVLMGANLSPGTDAIEQDVIRLFENRRDSLMKLPDANAQNQLRLTELVLKEPHINPANLKSINKPVLVVAGEFDVVKRDHTMLIQSSIKDAQLEIIKGSDHYAPLKNSKVFNKIVLDFLSTEKVSP